jgi:cobalamin biosynthetic protein CobC
MPVEHGGDLVAARRLFPRAPNPFVDLSTGINPNAYPLPPLPPALFARLPQPDAAERLASIAAAVYGAPAPACVIAAPGTQSLLALVAGLLPPGRAAILGPTYAEHARAAALAGHRVAEVTDISQLGAAGLAVVVHPNNPDGRMSSRDDLIALADTLRGHAGLLVVDEAFIEVAPPGMSLAGDLGRGNIVVLRSFGKFFGLAGLRLGFALAAPDIASRLRTALGPWAVSGPALAIGQAALADTAWIEATRAALAQAAQRLDALLVGAGLRIVGGTSLFRLVETPVAAALFDWLGNAGILVRRFTAQPSWLRFGLPANEPEWERLAYALAGAAASAPASRAR